MGLKTRVMIATAVAAAIALVANGASAVSRNISYAERPLDDARVVRMWGDMIPEIKANGLTASAYISEVSMSDGRDVTVTQLWSPLACGALDCPTRVFEGDEMILDTTACTWLDKHVADADGGGITACGIDERFEPAVAGQP